MGGKELKKAETGLKGPARGAWVKTDWI